MTIDGIYKNITKLWKSSRKPAPIIPKILMWCSLAKRPGLSCLASTAAIISSQSSFGAPTQANFEDGTPNMMNRLINQIVCEVYRAIREDMNTQVSIGPGQITSVMGSNGVSTNINFVGGRAQSQ